MSPLPTLALLAACMTPSDDLPREFGVVDWQRELQPALDDSAATGRPVLLLFQEVPGWSTCVAFGEGPLSFPPLVEAAEELFVPVAIRNNVDGYEKTILEQYDEPTWNNPVVRFVDDVGKDLIPRQDRVWQTGPLLARMVRTLEAARRPVPAWLDTVAQETASGEVQTAVFAMTWFWEGEAHLGGTPGVVSTQAAWHEGLEVVEVGFLPGRVPFGELLEVARKGSCATRVFTTTADQLEVAREVVGDAAQPLEGTPRASKDADQLYYLERSPLRYVPLTPLQARRANAELWRKGDPAKWLSPRQVELAEELRQVEDGRLEDLSRPTSWGEVTAYQRELEERLSR